MTSCQKSEDKSCCYLGFNKFEKKKTVVCVVTRLICEINPKGFRKSSFKNAKLSEYKVVSTTFFLYISDKYLYLLKKKGDHAN